MKITDAQHDISRILFTEEEIARRVAQLGAQMTQDYQGEIPVMVCILRGAAPFFTDLCRRIEGHLFMDFITVSSYGDSSKSSGIVKLTKDVSIDVSGRHVVIVDDVIDSGLTMRHLKELFMLRGPKSVKSCCFLDKKDQHNDDLAPDYVGFDCPNEFVVGYGLDYANHYRNLPYVAALKREVYE